MATEVFQKDRYIFSTRVRKKEILDKKKLVKEIVIYEEQLEEFKLSFNSLCNETPRIDKKNVILNIAKYVCERKKLIEKIKKKKKIPIRDIAFETRLKEEFIKQYEKYILAYIILFLDKRLSEINKYLRIEIRELDELSLVPVVDNSDGDLKKGIALRYKKRYGKVIILTNQGEFFRIIDNNKWEVGDEVVGKKHQGIKKYFNKIVIAVVIGIIVLKACNIFYNSVSSTILLKTTSDIKIEVNKLDKVVSVYSPTEKGKELVNNLELNNKNVDKVVSEILIYAEKNNMIPQNGTIRVAVTGEPLDFEKLKGLKEIVANQENKNGKYILVFNNSGEEFTLRAK
ncbi:anti-sigma-I factor RsgI family protein [Clostridium massiliamazoniense]|uniref:anti-sigma-I factor RsgI family protein n=1 Tax=Clostridium massiliamazoniense TaxID=1347366 RepID=UPI0006D79A31|nr:anti-sigma factor domain-containing protein [Clostridium massiliamazoniense]